MVIMKGKDENILVVKSKNFAVRIIRMYQWIRENKNEYLLCKQCVRSGTSIGANIREAIAASSKADFTAKLNISLKEANETQYWLELFRETDYIDNTMYDSAKVLGMNRWQTFKNVTMCYMKKPLLCFHHSYYDSPIGLLEITADAEKVISITAVSEKERIIPTLLPRKLMKCLLKNMLYGT